MINDMINFSWEIPFFLLLLLLLLFGFVWHPDPPVIPRQHERSPQGACEGLTWEACCQQVMCWYHASVHHSDVAIEMCRAKIGGIGILRLILGST